MRRIVTSWGRVVRREAEWIEVPSRRAVAPTIAAGPRPGLPFGNGRSYGDVCLNGDGVLWSMRGADRFIGFDPASGVVECEAGALLRDLLDLIVPAGWFVPVTPGTRLVTIGGAIANDVHGKNHHAAGTFGEHVRRIDLRRTDGTLIRCGPGDDRFAATVGGLGLTGVIESACLQLRPIDGAWIDGEEEPFDSLERFFELSEEAVGAWEYTVAWVDCTASTRLGRGVFFRGNHSASAGDETSASERTFPLELPTSLVNGPSVRAFNALYRLRHRRTRRFRRHYGPFFYPLDAVLRWNRIYGARGFYQYQCVVPSAVQGDAAAALLRTIAASGTGSFLAVLKVFADRAPCGLLSFPMAGTTLALDFPNRGAATSALFDSLDAIVAAAGGRLYPAKDARMPAALFRAGYPRWSEFERHRDPGISSEMSRRLTGA